LHIGTYTGHYEDVKGLADLLDEYEQRTGHSVPIHGKCSGVSEQCWVADTLHQVDGASGGFIAPFAHVRPTLVDWGAQYLTRWSTA
jgi:glutamate decarboxylase